jgi:hypothetical protein
MTAAGDNALDRYIAVAEQGCDVVKLIGGARISS